MYAVVLFTTHSAFDLTWVTRKTTCVLDTRGATPSGDNTERL